MYNKNIFLYIYMQYSMRKLKEIKEQLLKQNYINSDVMKIIKAISSLDALFEKVPNNTKMESKEKSILLKKETKKVRALILAYAKKNKTIPLELQQLNNFVDLLLDYIENTNF